HPDDRQYGGRALPSAGRPQPLCGLRRRQDGHHRAHHRGVAVAAHHADLPGDRDLHSGIVALAAANARHALNSLGTDPSQSWPAPLRCFVLSLGPDMRRCKFLGVLGGSVAITWTLVSRTRSSHAYSAGPFANFGFKGTLASLRFLVSLWFGSSLR